MFKPLQQLLFPPDFHQIMRIHFYYKKLNVHFWKYFDQFNFALSLIMVSF